MMQSLSAVSCSGVFPFSSGMVVAEQYTLEGEPRRGSVGFVYEAFDRIHGCKVAIKFVHPEVAAIESRAARFLREFEFLTRIGNYEHVAQPYGRGQLPVDQGGLFYHVVEYCEGTTLFGRMMTTRSFHAADIFDLARQLARALESCHAAQVVHRDVNPSNIFLTPRRVPAWWKKAESGGVADPYFARVKLIDFSHAGCADPEQPPRGSPQRFTKASETPGTPGYMPPEQVRGDAPNPAMDVFSMGVTLREMITGRRMFPSLSPEEFARYREGALPVPPIYEGRDDIPVSLLDVVSACVCMDPGSRPTIGQAREQFDREWRRFRNGVSGGHGGTKRILGFSLVQTEAPSDAGTGVASCSNWYRLAHLAATDSIADITSEDSLRLPADITSGDSLRLPSEFVAANVSQDALAQERPRRLGSTDRSRSAFGAWVAFWAVLVLTVALGISTWLLVTPDRPALAGESAPTPAPTPSNDEREEPGHALYGTHPPLDVLSPDVGPAADRDVPHDRVEGVAVPDPTPTTPKRAAKGRRRASAPCPTDLAEQVRDAERRRDWVKIVDLTATARCWRGRNVPRLQLQAEALLSLGRYPRCAALANETTDPTVRALARKCEHLQ